MDKLHKPLVAACKIETADSRIVMQPENQGGSSSNWCAQGRKRMFERKWVYVLPCGVVKQKFTKAVGASGRVVPKRLAGLPVSPVTSAETNMDVSVEESGLVSVEEFGPTSADEDVVQEARKRRRQNRYQLSPWTAGSSGNRKTEHMTHSLCSFCEIAGVHSSGVTRCHQRV